MSEPGTICVICVHLRLLSVVAVSLRPSAVRGRLALGEREGRADTHADTEAAYEQYFKAMREFEAMRNRRATESIVFEAWRSLNSNRRQGG